MKRRHLQAICFGAVALLGVAACSSAASGGSQAASGSGSVSSSGGTINVGLLSDVTGAYASGRTMEEGVKARFALQNAAGGIGGVKLAIATKDDQFNPAMTKTNVDGWIQSNSVQAFDVFGSGPLAAVAADQNLACLPELLASATDDTYRNIAKYPWTTEFLPSNNVEEAAEVKVIQAEFPSASKMRSSVGPNRQNEMRNSPSACVARYD